MSYLVIARKWRPQTFEELVGQEQVSRTLSNAIRSNRVAHAFLFTGLRGVGKTTAARILAKALNCANGPSPIPCNTCLQCQEITAGNAVDVLEIDGASNTGVDDVREIIENVRYQPAKCRFKIYIIDEVHMLSTSAFNALLKTLEEPPPHVKFIFATTDPHKVPHTIHSRCQRYDFKRISTRLIADRLAEIARSEEIEIGDRALFLIAREGEGSMRDAQSLFDQVIAFAGKHVADDDVRTALGLADRSLLYATGAAIAAREPRRAVEILNDLHQFGYDMRRFARELLEHFRNLAVARLAPVPQLLPELPDEELAEIERQAAQLGTEDCDRCFQVLLRAEAEVARASSPKLVMEMTLIKLATLAPVLPAAELLRRLDALDGLLAGSPARPRSATEAPQRNRVAAAAPPPAAGPPPAAPTPAVPPASAAAPVAADGSWDGFLAFVAKEKVTIHPYLQACQPPALDTPDLTLRVPAGYYFDYLAQAEHTQLVGALAQRFFSRKWAIKVVAIAADTAPAGEPAESAASLHAAALEDPRVRAAVEILGGAVQEVKPRNRRGKGSA